MISVFKALLRKERPSYILSFHTATAQQLSVVTCKYAIGEKYYVASSFYTDAWISKEPTGPDTRYYTQVRSELAFKDIAIIRECPDVLTWHAVSLPHDQDVQDIWDAMREKFNEQVSLIFEGNEFGDYVQTKLCVAPYPVAIMHITNEFGLVGTILVDSFGEVRPLLVCEQRIYGYVDELRVLQANFTIRSGEISLAPIDSEFFDPWLGTKEGRHNPDREKWKRCRPFKSRYMTSWEREFGVDWFTRAPLYPTVRTKEEWEWDQKIKDMSEDEIYHTAFKIW